MRDPEGVRGALVISGDGGSSGSEDREAVTLESTTEPALEITAEPCSDASKDVRVGELAGTLSVSSLEVQLASI